jgi:hypothetical protein
LKEYLQPLSELPNYFKMNPETKGFFADTSILFSATYPLDSFHDEVDAAFNLTSKLNIIAFTNVNVRAEFLESHRRVLIAECLIELFETMGSDLEGVLFEKLKSHRTIFRKRVLEEKASKMDVNQIKVFRTLLSKYQSGAENGWTLFCRNYLSGKLTPVWTEAEEELGLNFISLRSDDRSPYLDSIPEWETVVDLMGRYGIGSADAMILNMFLCSKIPVLLTADLEMAECAVKEAAGVKNIFVPERLIGFR